MNCLPLIMNSRDHVSCAQHLEVTYTFEKILKFAVANLSDVIAYVALMPTVDNL